MSYNAYANARNAVDEAIGDMGIAKVMPHSRLGSAMIAGGIREASYYDIEAEAAMRVRRRAVVAASPAFAGERQFLMLSSPTARACGERSPA